MNENTQCIQKGFIPSHYYHSPRCTASAVIGRKIHPPPHIHAETNSDGFSPLHVEFNQNSNYVSDDLLLFNIELTNRWHLELMSQKSVNKLRPLRASSKRAAKKNATLWFVLSKFYTSFSPTHFSRTMAQTHISIHSPFVLIEFIIWILFQNKSLCWLVLFCFVLFGWGFFAVSFDSPFLMNYLENESKWNEMNWNECDQRPQMFGFVLFLLLCLFLLTQHRHSITIH